MPWVRVFRKYRRFSLQTWIAEMVYAIRWNKAPEVEALLFSDGRISSSSEGKVNIRHHSSGFASLLHVAVGLHHAAIARLLLAAGADPFALDCSGRTPAHELFGGAAVGGGGSGAGAARGQISSLQEAAETASVLCFFCPGLSLLTYPNNDDLPVDVASAYDRDSDLFGVQCGQVSLVRTLNDLSHLQERATLKKNHQLQLHSSASSIIDLIDPGKTN
jgi:hypothetical protein